MAELSAPELLAPAGSMQSLEAAIEAGADAVYLGGAAFNARANARNFTREDLKQAFSLCRRYKVKTHVAMNTLLPDRELKPWLDEAGFLWEAGADALIVADLGAAALIRRYIPGFPLHASTQAGIHSIGGALLAKKLGFERAVLARELSVADIKEITEHGGIETEIFIHGALCVSVSGQCLFSSMVGGRSGNRGECAQPCRLPYNGSYPLSLRDCCLAGHVKEILSLGVRSLKIEGRMKGPEYVYGTVRMWRALLDEGRNATPGEIKELEALFSRSGTTDGYFTGKLDGMSGIRTKEDKEKTAALKSFAGLTKAPLFPEVSLTRQAPLIPGEAAVIAAAREGFPASKEKAADDNALSYAAASGALLSGKDCGNSTSSVNTVEMSLSRYRLRSASFSSLEQLEAYNACADRQFFDLAFVPVREYKSGCGANGVEVPFYCPPGEEKGLIKALESAKKAGARYALCGNPEKAELLRDIGFSLLGDFRLNITNTATGALMREFGFERVILSPELTLPRMRDIPFARSAVVYGRVPLMLLRRCVRKSLIGCRACAAAADKTLWLCDRRGYRFPVLKTGDCMNTVYNSLPHWMGDRKKALEAAGIGGEHFIFSVETGAECAKITGDWLNSKIKSSPVKRINDK